MLQHRLNANPTTNIAIQHRADEINAILAHDIRHAEIAVHDLVDTVEGVFFVDYRIQEDAEGPDVLFFAAVRLAG